MTTIILFWVLVSLAFLFALTNGFINGGGLVSTVVTTRALDPLPALLVVAGCEIVGLLVLGGKVSSTLAVDVLVIPPTTTSQEVLVLVVAGLLGALTWSLLLWRSGLPSSTTHALMGGLAGAAWSALGIHAVHWPVFIKLLLFLGMVPVVAFAITFLFTKAVRWVGGFLTPAFSRVIRGLQVFTMAGSAMAHGSNDGQKTIGLIVLAAVSVSGLHSSAPPLPLWAVVGCGLTLALGVLLGSRRTIHTLGRSLYHVERIEGFCTGLSTMLLVGASSLGGVPMSSSHVVSTSIIGAGTAVHPRGVRWSMARDILMAWFVTLPMAALAASCWMLVLEGTHVVP